MEIITFWQLGPELPCLGEHVTLSILRLIFPDRVRVVGWFPLRRNRLGEHDHPHIRNV